MPTRAGFCEPARFPRRHARAGDEDLAAALAREAFEENQVRVGATAYLEYQEVRRPGRAPFAQVRMTGVVAEFVPRAPDPDGGRTYWRLMTSLRAVPALLGGPRSRRRGQRCGSRARCGACRLTLPPLLATWIEWRRSCTKDQGLCGILA